MQCNIATADLNARLNGTICMYKDIPYFIMCSDSQHTEKIHLCDLLTKNPLQEISVKDPDFDVATPPLGYIQIKKNQVAFSERLPHRQFRQGVTQGVIHFSFFSQAQRMTLHSEAFRDTMMKQYRNLNKILIDLIADPEYGEYALSNDVALVKSVAGVVKVYFKHEEVAFSSLSELKKKSPSIHVPTSTKAWITERYLSKFNWTIVQ